MASPAKTSLFAIRLRDDHGGVAIAMSEDSARSGLQTMERALQAFGTLQTEEMSGPDAVLLKRLLTMTGWVVRAALANGQASVDVPLPPQLPLRVKPRGDGTIRLSVQIVQGPTTISTTRSRRATATSPASTRKETTTSPTTRAKTPRSTRPRTRPGPPPASR